MGNLTLVYMLLVSRQVPVSQQYWRKRIGTSLADRSRVELALLPRLSLTRLSRTQSLFLEDHSFFTLLLLPAGSAASGWQRPTERGERMAQKSTVSERTCGAAAWIILE
ncbi:unnamed protein product [Dovyalis caffra]|uniref:Secreted protein n=1 Tax=Dovyalis caffra TaxID=77055 RepID=A0AAV1QVW1_9ROSI|nr:unnamed protein product [Dovyalis caffra]